MAKKPKKAQKKRSVRSSEIGSHAPNAYQGHRSEMIAEFFFSGFGTVVPVPRPADTGIDLYCTLTDPAGKKAFSTHTFTVQVKSDYKPLTISSARSIEWLIRHPLPLFLCIVEKKQQRIKVYTVCSRFAVWAFPPLPESITIVPGGGPKKENHFYLQEPFINANFADIASRSKMADFRNKLLQAIEFEDENLFRVRMGSVKRG